MACFLRSQWHIVHRLFEKMINNQEQLLLCIIGPIEGRNHKKTASFVEEKMHLFARQCTSSQIDKKRLQKLMNYASNCFLTHLILQIWPPATFICPQTQRDGSRVRDFYQMKRPSGKSMGILEALTNRITRKASKC